MTHLELKTLREFLGFTQQDLAMRLGLSKRSIQYYESGEQPVPRVVMLALQAIELERK